MARRVLVVYTGGTLGMQLTERGWEPGADLQGWLTRLVDEKLPGLDWQLVTLDPLIDSSNAGPGDWQRIVQTVLDHRDDADAFVVLHGTDTLGFSAAATHFALAGLRRAVVLTGAQRSLVVDDSDAPGNVLGALRCALDERLDRVALFFDDTLMVPHHATKVSSEDDHAFDTINVPPLAVVDEAGELVFNERPETHEPGTMTPLGELRPYRPTDLVVLTLHPGLAAERVRALLTPPPEALVLRAYGVGNAPDNDPELLEVLAQASAAGTVVVVTTQCPHGGVHLGTYAVSQGLLATGAVPGGDLTTDAIVAWLSHLLAQGLGPGEIRGRIQQSLC